MILFVPRRNRSGQIAVAVEVERHVKSDKRLRAKLAKYASRSLLDGLIYICERDAILERLRQVYFSPSMGRLQRIQHYHENFFLFAYSNAYRFDGDIRMRNAGLHDVWLQMWITHLASTIREDRRDKTFNYGRLDVHN